MGPALGARKAWAQRSALRMAGWAQRGCVPGRSCRRGRCQSPLCLPCRRTARGWQHSLRANTTNQDKFQKTKTREGIGQVVVVLRNPSYLMAFECNQTARNQLECGLSRPFKCYQTARNPLDRGVARPFKCSQTEQQQLDCGLAMPFKCYQPAR